MWVCRQELIDCGNRINHFFLYIFFITLLYRFFFHVVSLHEPHKSNRIRKVFFRINMVNDSNELFLLLLSIFRNYPVELERKVEQSTAERKSPQIGILIYWPNKWKQFSEKIAFRIVVFCARTGDNWFKILRLDEKWVGNNYEAFSL